MPARNSCRSEAWRAEVKRELEEEVGPERDATPQNKVSLAVAGSRDSLSNSLGWPSGPLTRPFTFLSPS